ncbi:MAG: lipid-A-disaccharide synthase [Desulfobacterales bacterium]|nr:lipid-A-disaccharide synthase [Desulfobacterales bacterium]
MKRSPAAARVMIVAGEASGDQHGAILARELRDLAPDCALSGMGGREMAGAGVDILVDINDLAVMGLVEVLGQLGKIRRAMRVLEQRLRQQPPALLVLIDYPGFNLILARKAHKLNIPVLYYISPKVWAWRQGRIKKIKKYVDRMAVILPFEEEYFRGHGMAVDFVGNPMLDSVATTMSGPEMRAELGIGPDRTVVGLLPGSRRQEIARMLPLFIAAAERIAPELNNPVFLLPLASTLGRADLDNHGLAGTRLDIRVSTEARYDLMAVCAAVLAASGTVALELAILNVPMVVSYRVSPLTYHLARHFIKVRYASLVNLIAGREVVPELLQNDATPEKLAAAITPLLLDETAHRKMAAELAGVRQQLGGPGASRRCARLILEMTGG